jgi:hypothetical protein
MVLSYAIGGYCKELWNDSKSGSRITSKKKRGPSPLPTPPPPPPPSFPAPPPARPPTPPTFPLSPHLQGSATTPLLALPAPQLVPTVNSVEVLPPTTTAAILPVVPAPAVAVQNPGGQTVIQPPPSGGSSSPMEDVELTGLGLMNNLPFVLVPPPLQTPVDVFDMSTLLAALPVYLPVSMDIDVAGEEARVDDDELMDAPAVVVEQNTQVESTCSTCPHCLQLYRVFCSTTTAGASMSSSSSTLASSSATSMSMDTGRYTSRAASSVDMSNTSTGVCRGGGTRTNGRLFIRPSPVSSTSSIGLEEPPDGGG